ncbi:hypothetical protein DFH06DRAFT_202462 [Mycena polygramma]|nr:hypothetical protein DFH06DRAFT_202462 [Mycena polygramma]
MAGSPNVYAASCNPPRSAKQRPRSLSESSSASEYTPEPRRIVPLSPKHSKAVMDAEPSTGAKRGRKPATLSRKPATLSRTAREAQRKLNHSIIEKARRTKINDALATLRQLVPVNYGQPAAEDDEADGEDAAKAPKKAAGKREEKEKEFKLEILVRTVSFMQDLIDRVAALEDVNKSSSCANCATSSVKRKRSEEAGEEESRPVAKKRHEAELATPETSPSIRPEVSSPAVPPVTYSGERLPSISSWLVETGQRPSPRASPEFQSHLPSPPSSTQFAPARTPSQLPPALSLGSIATQALLSARTPEDESAASLLLEISASSPTFHEGNGIPRQIQTPSSLLGMQSNRR